jgi:hypothetical protein
MKLLAILFISAIFFVPANAQENIYGTGVELTEKISISEILKNPEEFVGRKVLVEGKIIDVCQHAGCWIDIEGSTSNEMIKIKVKDGEIVFPVEAKGSTALVEGVVYSIELDHEEAIEYYEHFAEDAGKEFDPSTVTGPVTIYQIKGLGAVINIQPELPEGNE